MKPLLVIFSAKDMISPDEVGVKSTGVIMMEPGIKRRGLERTINTSLKDQHVFETGLLPTETRRCTNRAIRYERHYLQLS